MCKGDSHSAYGLGPFDHIEPVFGLYSNHPLTDEEVYDDDWLVHGSDYALDGDKNLGYFRKFSSMVDTVAMDGNCKDAQAGWGKNEMYPCFNDQKNYGAAITGIVDPKKRSLRVNIFTNTHEEPDVRIDQKAVALKGWLYIHDTVPGKKYVVYRFNNKDNLPTDSSFEDAKFDSKHEFTALKTAWKYQTDDIMSDSEAYFVCLPVEDKETATTE